MRPPLGDRRTAAAQTQRQEAERDGRAGPGGPSLPSASPVAPTAVTHPVPATKGRQRSVLNVPEHP